MSALSAQTSAEGFFCRSICLTSGQSASARPSHVAGNDCPTASPTIERPLTVRPKAQSSIWQGRPLDHNLAETTMIECVAPNKGFCDQKLPEIAHKQAPHKTGRAHPVVLIVDDEPFIRDLLRR